MEKKRYYQLKRKAFEFGIRTNYEIIDANQSHAIVKAEVRRGGDKTVTFGEVISDTPVADAIVEADLLAFAMFGLITDEEAETSMPEDDVIMEETTIDADEGMDIPEEPKKESKSIFSGIMNFIGKSRQQEQPVDDMDDEPADEDDAEIKEDADIEAEAEQEQDQDTRTMPDAEAEPEKQEEDAGAAHDEHEINLEELEIDVDDLPETKNVPDEAESNAEPEAENVQKPEEKAPEEDDDFKVLIGRYKYQSNNSIKEILRDDPKFIVNIMSIERPNVEYRKYIEMIREYMDRHSIHIEDLDQN